MQTSGNKTVDIWTRLDIRRRCITMSVSVRSYIDDLTDDSPANGSQSMMP